MGYDIWAQVGQIEAEDGKYKAQVLIDEIEMRGGVVEDDKSSISSESSQEVWSDNLEIKFKRKYLVQ